MCTVFFCMMFWALMRTRFACLLKCFMKHADACEIRLFSPHRCRLTIEYWTQQLSELRPILYFLRYSATEVSRVVFITLAPSSEIVFHHFGTKLWDCFLSLQHQVMRLLFITPAPSPEIVFNHFGTKSWDCFQPLRHQVLRLFSTILALSSEIVFHHFSTKFWDCFQPYRLLGVLRFNFRYFS
jgi:hypothetical protein